MHLTPKLLSNLSNKEKIILSDVYLWMKFYLDSICPSEGYFTNPYYVAPEEGRSNLMNCGHVFKSLSFKENLFNDEINLVVESDYREVLFIEKCIQQIRLSGPIDRYSDKAYIRARKIVKEISDMALKAGNLKEYSQSHAIKETNMNGKILTFLAGGAERKCEFSWDIQQILVRDDKVFVCLWYLNNPDSDNLLCVDSSGSIAWKVSRPKDWLNKLSQAKEKDPFVGFSPIDDGVYFWACTWSGAGCKVNRTNGIVEEVLEYGLGLK